MSNLHSIYWVDGLNGNNKCSKLQRMAFKSYVSSKVTHFMDHTKFTELFFIQHHDIFCDFLSQLIIVLPKEQVMKNVALTPKLLLLDKKNLMIDITTPYCNWILATCLLTGTNKVKTTYNHMSESFTSSSMNGRMIFLEF